MDAGRKRFYSGAPWEDAVGYCRAMRVGNAIYVTGTAPVADDGSVFAPVFAPNDAYRQTQRCFEIIEQALTALGATRGDVVRTRMYVTDIRRWEEFGRAHREFVGLDRPCTTMVEVKSLIDPAMLVEIEVDAICELDD
ncbi:MAG: RidA family protein [Planctomycetes bacterium]|nr:RidA family protein [Planctomycetota bacterium]